MVLRIDRNIARNKGRYDWKSIKEKIQAHRQNLLLYENAKFFDKMSEIILSEQDFIITQSPSVCSLFCFGFRILRYL